MYMNGSGKTDHMNARIEVYFIDQYYMYVAALMYVCNTYLYVVGSAFPDGFFMPLKRLYQCMGVSIRWHGYETWCPI